MKPPVTRGSTRPAIAGSGSGSTEIELVAKETNDFVIGDATGGNFYDPDDNPSRHSDPTGRYVVPYFRANTGANVVPERLVGLSFELA